VEVILAILIISGIIAVLLYFYQRAAETRELVMRETEFVSVGRLFMEQITGELRTARAVEDQFSSLDGSSNSISFICTTIPRVSKWITSSNELVILAPVTDLKRVRYSLMGGTNLFDAKGLDRSEEMLLSSVPAGDTNTVESASLASTNLFSMASTNSLEMTNRVQLAAAPLTDKIRLLQFRYWSGMAWTDNWSGMELPVGVEVTIGQDPISKQSDESGGYSGEVFRRVVYLPNSTHPANRIAPAVMPEEPAP